MEERYFSEVAKRIECPKCREMFLRKKPLFVYILLGHAHPVLLVEKVPGKPELGWKLHYLPSFCGKILSSSFIPCVFGYHYVFDLGDANEFVGIKGRVKVFDK